ncbi:hypothetical protein [Saccharopolyspora sp. NPDC002376]
MLLRLAYLGVTNAFAMLRLLPMSDRDKDVEILALRHQITVLERQIGQARVRFTPADRAFMAALLHQLPRNLLRRLRLLVQPDTVLRWHRDLALADNLIRPGETRRARRTDLGLGDGDPLELQLRTPGGGELFDVLRECGEHPDPAGIQVAEVVLAANLIRPGAKR